MADFMRGLAGAGAGFATGGPIGAGLMGLAGLFGSKPQMPAEQRQQLALQNQISRQLMQFAGSVPGSSPGELAGLSSAQGLLGEQQRQAQQQIFAGGYNPLTPTGGTGDMLNRLMNQQIAQRMALTSGMFQDADARRRQALMEASGVGRTAGEFIGQPPNMLPQVMGQLAGLFAQQQAQRQGQQQWQQQQRMMQDWLRSMGAGMAAGPGSQPANAMMGMGAPGNEFGGMNTMLNQLRQPQPYGQIGAGGFFGPPSGLHYTF